MSIEILSGIMVGFQLVMEKLGRCTRWENFPNKHYHQTSLDHSLTLTVVCGYFLSRERELEGVELNGEKIILHAATHDFCEAAMGDMTLEFKTDPRIKRVYKKIEPEATRKIFNQIPLLGDFLDERSGLEPESNEAHFFRAMEEVDYVLYAMSEYIVHGRKEFVEVFWRQRSTLTKFAETFKSIAEFYNAEVQKWVDEQIDANKDIINRIHKVDPKLTHLAHVAESLAGLKQDLLKNGSTEEEVSKIIKEHLGEI